MGHTPTWLKNFSPVYNYESNLITLSPFDMLGHIIILLLIKTIISGLIVQRALLYFGCYGTKREKIVVTFSALESPFMRIKITFLVLG